MTEHLDDIDLWRRFETDVSIPIWREVEASVPAKDIVYPILRFFCVRAINLGQAIVVLRHTVGASLHVEATVLLRVLYENYVQACFLVEDKNHAIERAKQFNDYYWIEHRKMHEHIGRNKNAMTARLMSSPLRKENIGAIRSEYDRVSKLGLDPSKPWHQKSLAGLAQVSGIAAEHDIVVSRLHAAVHSTPFLRTAGNPIPDSALIVSAITLIERTLKLIVDHLALEMCKDVQEALNASVADRCENFEPPVE